MTASDVIFLYNGVRVFSPTLEADTSVVMLLLLLFSISACHLHIVL